MALPSARFGPTGEILVPLLPIPNPPAVLPAAVPPLVPCPPSLLFPLHPIGRCPPPASPLSSSYILLPASSPFRRSSVLLLPSPSPARLCHRGVSFVRPFASLPSPRPSRMPRPSSLRLSPFASSASPLPPLDPCLPPPPSGSRPSSPLPIFRKCWRSLALTMHVSSGRMIQQTAPGRMKKAITYEPKCVVNLAGMLVVGV